MSTQAGDAVLGRCVACPTSEFVDSYWGRRPLLSRAADLGGRGFTDLLDAEAVDQLSSTHALRTPFARMAKEGEVLGEKRFTRGGGAGAGVTDLLADDKVLTQMADGATLVLQGLHRSWPPLVHFGTALSAALGHPTQINSYVTPPQNQGFSAHYDVHDVFVLQVAGRKHWTIHEPVVDAPLDGQPWFHNKPAIAERVEQEPLIDTVLEPGDALYLPRGTVHSATALGETSIHLTVGIHPLTRRHLAQHLMALAGEVPELRTSLPAGVDLSDPAVLATHLAETVDALTAVLRSIEPGPVAERVGTDLMRRTRPEPIGPLASMVAADALTADSVVRPRGGLRVRLTERGEHLDLVLLDRTVTVPARLGDSVKVLLAGAPVALDALPLPAADAVSLARRLVREGIVVTA